MSMFENDQYRWRETYFVMFDSAKRPTLKEVQRALSRVDRHYMLTNLGADDEGRFDSLTVMAPDDFAALDICYLGGQEVADQGAEWSKEMTEAGCRLEERERIELLGKHDARFDILHFEQLTDLDDGGTDEMLDPGALLLVMEVLVKLTDGIALDPQAGTLL